MSRTRLATALVITALMSAAVVATLAHPPRARADPPRTASCKQVDSAKAGETWMNEQLAAGRTNITAWGLVGTGVVCAW